MEKVLGEFNLLDSKGAKSPMEENINLKKGNTIEQNTKYQSLIGGLMYIVQGTRPDITFATHYLSQFNNCHQQERFKALKRILR